MLGGWCADQARLVRPPCAGGGGGGQYASQAKPIRPSCAGGAGCQAGKVARQVRPPDR